MEETIRKKLTKNNGITLVALVVTIVVLLILAGVSINLVLGNNGIITKSKEAKEQHKEAAANEQKQMDDVSDWIDKNINPKSWEDILADANSDPDSMKHEEQLVSDLIGIGTDKKPVNMDLWNPTKLADGTYLLGNEDNGYSLNDAYVGNIIDGKIQGKVPQYVYDVDENIFKPVTKMVATLSLRQDLVIMPEIPNTVEDISSTFACTGIETVTAIPNSVINMFSTFYNCPSLKQVEEIPNSVTSLKYTFLECGNLKNVPDIPNSVTNMESTFGGCYNLEQAPEIPASVTNMKYTFDGCSRLTGTCTINANPSEYTDCFEEAATAEGTDLVLKGSSSMLSEILSTKSSDSNIAIGE